LPGAVDRIAESPAADGAATLREIASKAIETLATGRDCADQNAVAHFVASDANAEFVDHSNGLVADGEAGLDGIFAFENVEVGAADRSESHADHGFAGSGLGDGGILDVYLVGPTENEGLHCLGFAEAMVELYFLGCNGHRGSFRIDLYLCTAQREIAL
jgi:hypothetical protein